VHVLVQIALLRAEAALAGISEISQKQDRLLFFVTSPDIQKVSVLYGHPEYKRRILFAAGEKPHLSLRLKSENVIKEAGSFIKAYMG